MFTFASDEEICFGIFLGFCFHHFRCPILHGPTKTRLDKGDFKARTNLEGKLHVPSVEFSSVELINGALSVVFAFVANNTTVSADIA